jgi:4-hydroxy-tetrahydrodipicolinate reductase
MPLKVIVVGLGPIGLNAAKAVAEDKTLKLVGLVDIDPSKRGKTLGQLTGNGGKGGPKVVASIAEAAKAKPQVAIVTTASHFAKVAPTLRECIKRRMHVCSSCEEMSFPQYLNPVLAKKIDAEAKKAKVALLGTGVNPGFVMDYLPVVLSSQVAKVRGVKVFRRLDAATRRMPLQKKVGATMTTGEFAALKAKNAIGHMGIGESAAMIATGLGRKPKKGSVRIGLDPVIADRPMDSLLGRIEPGKVCGMRNTAKWSGEGLSVELDLIMAIGTTDPHDRVEIDGPVPLKLRIEGGTPGDTATVAAMLNGARVLPTAPPGLHTMLTIPACGGAGR